MPAGRNLIALVAAWIVAGERLQSEASTPSQTGTLLAIREQVFAELVQAIDQLAEAGHASGLDPVLVVILRRLSEVTR